MTTCLIIFGVICAIGLIMFIKAVHDAPIIEDYD
jgi:hypothetical protein